jgi:hypothetical protein
MARIASDGADCIGIGIGDEKHPKSMVARTTAGKRDVHCEATLCGTEGI